MTTPINQTHAFAEEVSPASLDRAGRLAADQALDAFGHFERARGIRVQKRQGERKLSTRGLELAVELDAACRSAKAYWPALGDLMLVQRVLVSRVALLLLDAYTDAVDAKQADDRGLGRLHQTERMRLRSKLAATAWMDGRNAVVKAFGTHFKEADYAARGDVVEDEEQARREYADGC